MEKFKMTDDDYTELRILAEYLIVHHKDIINANADYKLPTDGRVSEKLKFGAVIGYKGKTIYEVIKDKTISSRSLDLFKERFSTLRKRPLTDPAAKSYIARATNLTTKLESQKMDNGREADNNTNLDKKSAVIALFEDTKWYLYERSADGIERHIMEFKKSNIEGQLPVEIQSNGGNTLSWVGKATFTLANDFLIIETFYEAHAKTLPISFLIRISNRYTRIELCIGHMTLTSDAHRNVVSKLVVLENQSENNEPTKARFMLDETGTERSVGKEIYKLLHDITSSRLSSPHPVIINETMLKNWHAENERIKRRSSNKNIEGEYSVYYKGELDSDHPLTIDKLIIKENIHAELIADHLHEVDKGEPQTWQGETFYSSTTRAAFTALRGPVKEGVPENISAVFLILNIPAGGRVFDTLTGVVSGVNDRDEGALSLSVVAVKNSARTDSSDVHLDKIARYFKHLGHSSYIPPPKIPVATLEDLARNILP